MILKDIFKEDMEIVDNKIYLKKFGFVYHLSDLKWKNEIELANNLEAQNVRLIKNNELAFSDTDFDCKITIDVYSSLVDFIKKREIPTSRERAMSEKDFLRWKEGRSLKKKEFKMTGKEFFLKRKAEYGGIDN